MFHFIVLFIIIVWLIFLNVKFINEMKFFDFKSDCITKIAKLQKNWVYSNDPRLYKYTFQEMCDISFDKQNFYNKKYPIDSDF